MSDDDRTVAEATQAAGAEEFEHADRALLVVYNEDDPTGHTRLIELPKGVEVTMGRSRSTTLHIDSDRVSRNHARLVRRGDEIVVEDLGSRNGTRVNNLKIAEPTRVRSGDEIGVGPITAVVSVTSQMVRRPMVGTTAQLEERLGAEVDRGLRYHRSFALIMLRLDGAVTAVDAAVDRLVDKVRPMDTIAEYSPEEFAILVPEADSAAGLDMARQLTAVARAQALSQDPLTVRAGLAVFPTHSTQAGKLLSRAQTALREARSTSAADPVVAATQEDVAKGDEVIIRDAQMERVYALIRKVADTNMTVLIVGETGVGKEVVAEYVHTASKRRPKPFLRLNCASIPETLLESELFGHERGAFTGADRRHTGYFEAADGGTIFLDEIGEISAGLQAKLLRVLEERRFTRVGGTKEIEVDTRVVCATNRDLEDEVRQGAFREDLFFRISAFTVMVPPLRDRRAEIMPLAEHFATQAARQQGGVQPSFADAARATLEQYAWPGNVRELRNAIERASVLQDQGMIEIEHLPDRIREAADLSRPASSAGASRHDVREHIAEVERAAIIAAMDACQGNQTHAARKLGLSRRSLIYKLEKYGLKKKPASRT